MGQKSGPVKKPAEKRITPEKFPALRDESGLLLEFTLGGGKRCFGIVAMTTGKLPGPLTYGISMLSDKTYLIRLVEGDDLVAVWPVTPSGAVVTWSGSLVAPAPSSKTLEN